MLFQHSVCVLLQSHDLTVLEINSSSEENVELCALVCAEAFDFLFKWVCFKFSFLCVALIST